MLSGTQSSERTLKDGMAAGQRRPPPPPSLLLRLFLLRLRLPSNLDDPVTVHANLSTANEPYDSSRIRARFLDTGRILLGVDVTRCLNPVLLFSVSLGTR